MVTERSLDSELLEERFDVLFHHLVNATAWPESCWRQFVQRGDIVTGLESRTGDVGLMQINVRISRDSSPGHGSGGTPRTMPARAPRSSSNCCSAMAAGVARNQRLPTSAFHLTDGFACAIPSAD